MLHELLFSPIATFTASFSLLVCARDAESRACGGGSAAFVRSSRDLSHINVDVRILGFSCGSQTVVCVLVLVLELHLIGQTKTASGC